jgi:hypothetical protein
MAIVGVTTVRCPACDRAQDCRLVQSIHARSQPEAVAQLRAGELNVLACACGRRTQLQATLLYLDPDAAFACQVCPGGEAAMAEGEAAFRAAGMPGTLRLVPSQNALVEKVAILDAGLADWAIEMTKVLLLAATDDRDLDRVLLFAGVDGDALRWIRHDPDGPRVVASPLDGYRRLAARAAAAPSPRELRIDRAWAVAAVHQMISAAN